MECAYAITATIAYASTPHTLAEYGGPRPATGWYWLPFDHERGWPRLPVKLCADHLRAWQDNGPQSWVWDWDDKHYLHMAAKRPDVVILKG